MTEDHESIDQQLEQIDEKSEAFFQQCRLRSAMRLAREAARLSKSHQHATHYMRALFDQMRFGHGLLDPQATREASVELVALLEDEEQARRVQPDLDEHHYHWLCSWMTSCAYDNLAEATGTLSGYNSEGMHECINDGIQVCRQTGKLECIKCFREYASDVYLSADDLAMVHHQAQILFDYKEGDGDEKDRRWSARQKLARLSLLEGHAEQALEELQEADGLSQAKDVYLKLRAKLLVGVDLDTVFLLLDRDRYDWSQPAGFEHWIPETGEWPKFELERAKVDALAAAMAGKWADAIEILTDWDRRLSEKSCIHEWFEVRLRLIAAYRLSEDDRRVAALAKGLDARSRDAQDFLTIRRLQRLLDESVPCAPVPLIGPLRSGPFADPDAGQVVSRGTSASQPATKDGDSVSEGTEGASPEEAPTPLQESISQIMERIGESRGDDEASAEVLNEILGYQPEDVSDPSDAAYLVHLTQFLIRDTESAQRVWAWAQDMMARFPGDGTVMSVVARLGAYFRNADATVFENEIPVEQLEEWFRKSLTLNQDHPRNYLRAGEFFYGQGNLGEAERCLSRAFRLDRTDPNAAMRLAELYRETDRPRDALAVLDLCLRNGCEESQVAWEAGMVAVQLEQHDSVLTYMDKALELGAEPSWVHYYRGWALLEQQRFDEAREAIRLERELEPPGTLHLDILEACIADAVGDVASAEDRLDHVLATPLRDIRYLSLHGLVRLFERLWQCVREWPNDHPLRQQLVPLLLKAGLMPDDFFDGIRIDSEEEEDLNFYRCQVHQPLDEQWAESDGCLPDQDAWSSYDALWGVLAGDEEEAVARVLRFQAHCYPLPAEVVELEVAGEGFRDHPGVVWQGLRWSADEMDLDQGDDDEDDDES